MSNNIHAREIFCELNAIAQPAPQDIDDLFEKYMDWLEVQKFAAGTKRIYLSKTRKLIHHWKTKCPSLRIDQLTDSFLSHLRDVDRAQASTINGFITTIEQLSRCAGVTRPAVIREKSERKRQLNCLSAEDYNRFCSTVSSAGSVRDVLIVQLFLYSGLRPSECRMLKLSDVSPNLMSITVQGRRSPRAIMMTVRQSQVLAEWLGVREASQQSHSPFLFPSPTGQSLSPGAIDLIVRKLGWRARIVVSARLLRNTYLLFNKVADQRELHA
jgi:integrase